MVYEWLFLLSPDFFYPKPYVPVMTNLQAHLSTIVENKLLCNLIWKYRKRSFQWYNMSYLGPRLCFRMQNSGKLGDRRYPYTTFFIQKFNFDMFELV
jgi:hypothetical protein